MSRIDDWNYDNDHRVRAGRRRDIFKEVDERRMTATITVIDEDSNEEDVKVPVRFEVCETCDGTGSHVNPSIDSGGLTADDFAEDPDFAEEYVSGTYDVECYGCHGKRVTLVLDREKCDPEVLKRIDEMEESYRDTERIRDAERRYGA